MEPYTHEYLEKQERKARTSSNSGSTNSTIDTAAKPPGYYNYHLVGVVVHTGTADSGHYYSYVKERTGSSGTVTASGTTDASARWLWFNDSNVSVIEQDKLHDACSGGVEFDNRGNQKVWHACRYCLCLYVLFVCHAHTDTTSVHCSTRFWRV
jgi:ubiquitin C-terminal hydrolase